MLINPTAKAQVTSVGRAYPLVGVVGLLVDDSPPVVRVIVSPASGVCAEETRSRSEAVPRTVPPLACGASGAAAQAWSRQHPKDKGATGFQKSIVTLVQGTGRVCQKSHQSSFL